MIINSSSGGATKGDSRFSMPLAHLGNKKYYLGMFFKVITMAMKRRGRREL